MKNQKMLILSLLALIAINLTLMGCSSLGKAIAEDPSSPTMQGKMLLEQRCTVCHSLDRVYAMNTDEAGWNKIIDRMTQKGANLNAEERQKVIAYRTSIK